MARKKIPNATRKLISMGKAVDITKKPVNSQPGTDMDKETEPDISKLRKMPTDDLMTANGTNNLKKSNQTLSADIFSNKSQTNSRSENIKGSKDKKNSGRNLELRSKSKLHTIAGLTSFEKLKLPKSKVSASKDGEAHKYSKMKTIAGFTSHQAVKMLKNKRDFSVVKKPSLSSKKSLSKTALSRIIQKKISSVLKSNNNLWFGKDAVLAVRTEKKDEFYLCRTRINVYNYTSKVKINWFVNKAKKYKIPNSYKMGYRDVIDTASVLMQVNLNRLSRVTYQLPSDQLDEIMKLLRIAQDVERGEKTVDQLDDDVEKVVLIDKPVPKKPRLQKTASQKLRDKERMANRKKELKVEKKTRQKKIEGDLEPKRKKPLKKFTPKKLIPRPDIKVLDHDPLFETREPVPYVSKVANSRLIFRAIYLKDNKLLAKLLRDGNKIYKLYSKSLTENEYPADAAGKADDKNILLTLLEEFFGKKFSDRCKNNRGDPNLLYKLETGKYNRRSLGIHFIRKIMASRGSREGNNAFMKTENSVSYEENEFIEDFLQHNSNPALLETVEQFFEKKKVNIYENIFSHRNVHDLLLNGQPEIAGKVIQACLKHDSRAFIQLFRDVLLFSNEELTGCSPSNLRFVSKYVHKLNVFHCAAANKNSKYLEKLLSIQPEVHIADRKGNRPIHFAAACQSPENLKLLFEKGANLHDTNSSRKLPLHIAIENNRPHNVELLLDMASKNPSRDPLSSMYGVGSVNYRDYSGKTPLHLAAEKGFVEIAEILLKFGAQVNAQLGVSYNKLTPLMCAAAQGSLKMVQLLVKHGADVEQNDRMDRRAVIHACMNGSTSVLSYLLNIGASAEEPDSSGNSPLHYAAAYGWYFTVKLLLEAGVDPNASNMWKITPVSVAYLKSQVGIVQLLLNHEKVDINFSDDNGKTLIFHACESDLLQPDLAEQIKYIIEKKGALCNIKDNDDHTPLHCLALNEVKVDKANKETANIQSDGFKQSVAIAELLIKHGCDPKAVDQNNNTAAMLAINKVTNLPLCEYLLNQGSPVLFPSSSKPTTTILHEIADSLWCEPLNLEKLLQMLIKYNYLDNLKLMAQYVDSLGFTPLHTACWEAKQFKHGNHDNIEDRKLMKENWDHVRGFIRILVDKLGSDVNAKIQKKHFEDDEMPAPNSDKWWYQKQIAGRTAAHIIMLEYDPAFDDEFKIIPPGNSGQVFKDLVLRGTDINVLDENGCSPLSTCIQEDRSDLFDFMATQGKCDFNQKAKYDNQMISPLIIAAYSFCNVSTYVKKNADVICKLIDYGCDLNSETIDTKKKILHCVASQPDSVMREEVLKIVNKLAEKGYNFNSLDGKQRTGLHYALRANNGGLNQSFELEVRLIQLGTNLGLKDKHGRTPLQYIFNKTKKVSRSAARSGTNNDPAELTKLIGRNMTKQQINEKDKHGQTVVHQAAKQGATVCCMYLTLVGANVNLEDSNGNTALSLAVQNKHDGCATTLIQSGANLKSKVVITSQDEVMKKKLKQNIEKANKEVWRWQPNTLVKMNEPVRIISLYQAAIEYDLPGVAMFVTEADSAKSGLTLQDAITIALKSCKYNIALRILCTITDITQLHVKREHQQTLLHILALSGQEYKEKTDQIIVKIADFLLKAGFSATERDEYNCNPIIYAVLNRLFSLADFLAEKSAGYDVKYTDNFSRSYLAAALWRCHSNRIDQTCWNFIAKLVEAKFNLNQYFDLPLNPDLAIVVKSDQKKDPDYWQSYPQVKTTALFAAICCADFTITQNLLVNGANPNMTDGSKLTPLMYAIKLGQTNHVRLLLNYAYDPKKSYTANTKTKNIVKKIWPEKPRTMFNLTGTLGDSDESSESSDEAMETEEDESGEEKKDDYFTLEKTSSVDLHAKDSLGCTVLHYVAQTHPNGTFDNPEAAFVLARGGAKLKKDFSGLNPYQLALKSGAHKVAEVIRKHFKLPQEQPPYQFKEELVNDGVPEELKNWPDFKKPAEKVLRRFDSNFVIEDVYLHEVDSNCNIKDGELLKDETLDVYFDVLMTKVDVKPGIWGLYNFYQMQIVSQPKKSLFILFTRWGRIEDVGQFQHTPYATKEEAVKEFMKIFRQKSGNKWSDIKNFEKKANRYRLIEDAARKAPLPQKDVDLNLDSDIPSRIPKHLYTLVETLMNPKAMELTVSKSGSKNFTLALGQLNKELLMKGKELLDQIEKLVDEVEAYRKLTKDEREDSVNKSKYQNNLEKISELSNEYFHVIPTKNFSCEKIRPLDQQKNLVVQISNLNNMLNYEIASKMLLASMHYKTEYNPVDYVYRSVGCKIELMTPNDEMSQMILKYISNGGSDYKVHGIYKLDRNGESQRLKANGLGDHRLLWHGTKICNLLSILNRGLVICPPEANKTGWAYGKGIYFSDAFATSANYITANGDSSFMLLCEVALGKKLYYNSSENKEKNEKTHNSVVVENYSSSFCPSEWFHLPSGVCLPQKSQKGISAYNNTQYVILDPAQVCLRYLVEFSK